MKLTPENCTSFNCPGVNGGDQPPTPVTLSVGPNGDRYVGCNNTRSVKTQLDTGPYGTLIRQSVILCTHSKDKIPVLITVTDEKISMQEMSDQLAEGGYCRICPHAHPVKT